MTHSICPFEGLGVHFIAQMLNFRNLAFVQIRYFPIFAPAVEGVELFADGRYFDALVFYAFDQRILLGY